MSLDLLGTFCLPVRRVGGNCIVQPRREPCRCHPGGFSPADRGFGTDNLDEFDQTGWAGSGGTTLKSFRPTTGQLFTGNANTVLRNRPVLTAKRDLDPKATGYDFGFKFQFTYGSVAPFTHFLGKHSMRNGL